MKRIINIGKLLAILTILLGITHEAATFHPMIQEGLQGLDPIWRQTLIYFSLGCGALMIMCGVLFFILLRRAERHEFLAVPLIVIGIFAAANGILAVCYMFDNPFAWTGLCLGIGLLLVASVIRSRHNKS